VASTQAQTQAALRKLAMKLPGAEEAVACKGTPLESAAYKASKKTFLFVSAKDVRLKLDGSLAAARKLASKEPDRFQVGSLNWVWIGESYRAVVGALKPPRARRGGSARS
jgi:hypothetical protein